MMPTSSIARKVRIRCRALTVVFALCTGLACGGDQATAPQRWWLGKNLRIVSYEFLERDHRQSDLSATEILAYLDQLGGCDAVLLKGFHYWKGKFDESSWGYPRFRGLAENLIPKLHARGIKAGIFGFTDRQRSYADGPDHRRILEVWKEYVRLGADILFIDEESGRGGLDVPSSCLSYCDELRKQFGLPVGVFAYGSAADAAQVRCVALHADVIGEMGYNLFLATRGNFGLEDVTRAWSQALKDLPSRPVALWSGILVPPPEQGQGTAFWQERFGERTLAAYFADYSRKALSSGANGVFFHSLCRLDGLPREKRSAVIAEVRKLFKEMGRPERPPQPYQHKLLRRAKTSLNQLPSPDQ